MNKKNKLPKVAKHYHGYTIRGSVSKYSIYAGKNRIKDGFKTIDLAMEHIAETQRKMANRKTTREKQITFININK